MSDFYCSPCGAYTVKDCRHETPTQTTVDWPVRSCERVTLSRVLVVQGRGVEGDPVREVTYWYDDTGTLIARRDPWLENPGGGC